MLPSFSDLNPRSCDLCPRRCGANRAAGERGACGAADDVLIARAALHFWEEPPISGSAEEADCAAQGLDWTRAEEAYGNGKSDDDLEDFDDCGCGHDHGRDHDDFDDYEGYGYDDPYNAGFGYSSN